MDGSYSADFRAELADLMRWRRDVRRFRTDPVPAAVLERCLAAFRLAPSVGLSEPWRLISVQSPVARAAALENFRAANAQALAGYADEKAQLYTRLKLSGMAEAPVQLAVFCDDATPQGAGLGAATMPETRAYSVVGAISLFWLAARAEGLGVGWVSVLDADQLTRDLAVSAGWKLVAYLCVGWPEQVLDTPELEIVGWEKRQPALWLEER
ncbi:5,6-dimethylbenzimidazole synthase [Rhodobacter ferrooxidans]|uniref:Cob(II)yrinic acid a,c-diamide reductase n=1 Tax=Rhodobacter ferrooxidans TaxID=371731 RepID=C8RYF4_9RHOB|nr:5,6-dimethylbenzimidazole synthase [Rhodobacter sp. SW2]EEW26142.1 cob(II)yrinic acid a,c-diamide reductase [Rhodobacter sp. SW2]